MNVTLAQIWDESLWIIKAEVYKKFKGADAEDVIQDMAEHLNNKLSKYNPEVSSNLGGWIRMVVRNKCFDILRHDAAIKKHMISVEYMDFKSVDLDSDSTHNGFESMDSHRKRVSIQDIFNDLNERDRQLLILKLLRNKKGKEIEKIMGITNCAQYYSRVISAIKTNLGKEKLQILLDEFDVEGNLDNFQNLT